MTTKPTHAAHLAEQRLSSAVYLYVLACAAVAVALVAATLHGFPRDHWLDFAIFLIMGTLAERWYVESSSEGETSLSTTVNLAAAILFGPAFAAIVAATAMLIVEVSLRKSWEKVVFNCAQFAITAVLAGLVYQALRKPGPLSLELDAPVLILTAVVYLFVNNTLLILVLTLTGRSFWNEWSLLFHEGGILHLAMAPLAFLLAFAYQESRWNLLYFPLLILVIYTGFRLYVNLQEETDSALVVLADTVDKRDEYTFAHSTRVAGYSEAIARRLNLPRKEVELIVSAARVHDLGKIATDNRILYKKASLTDQERAMINAHPGDGSDLAGQFTMYRRGRLYIRHHHERWDGRGYPDGLAGGDIPLGARIIAVADAYDAMTSDRPYRGALPHEIALAELQRGSGRQFDPHLVEAFIAVFRHREVPQPMSALEPRESCSYS